MKYSEVHTTSPSLALKMAGKPPEIPAGYDFMVEAFMVLSTERPIVEGAVLYIPILKIIEYLEWNGITKVKTVSDYIHKMDAEFVKLQQTSLNKKMKAATAPKG